jgi:hypothetical protein
MACEPGREIVPIPDTGVARARAVFGSPVTRARAGRHNHLVEARDRVSLAAGIR